MIQKTPIFIDLDRRRRVVFNLNTEILIRSAGKRNASIFETIGEAKDPETGETKRSLDVDVENLRVYLWAAIQEDAERHNETLSLADVGALLTNKIRIGKAVVAVTRGLAAYYGDGPDEPGEASAPAL